MKLLVLLCMYSLMAGCSSTSESLYFGTYTRVGIDASTDGVGIGVKNSTVQITPPKKDGSSFDVVGTSDIDLGYTYAIIEETVAVGAAAVCASKAQTEKSVTEVVSNQRSSTEVVYDSVIFGAFTSWSLLDLNVGANSPSQGINFGYKRGVGVKMPIKDDKVGSIFAKITVNNSKSDRVSQPYDGGTRTVQTFATGIPAIIMSSRASKAITGDDSVEGCVAP